MLGSYLTSAFRALRRDKLYAAINIGGLAVALSAGLLVALFVRYEFSYDQIFTEPERIYRLDVTYHSTGQDKDIPSAAAMFPAVERLNNDFSGQLLAVYLTFRSLVVSVDGNHYREFGALAEERFFQVLDFPFLLGDPATALDRPDSVLLTREYAEKYFGTIDVVGRTLRVNGEHDFRVTAVLEDIPKNTHLAVAVGGMQIIFPHENLFNEIQESLRRSWFSASGGVYMRLQPGVLASDIARQFPEFIARNVPADLLELLGTFDLSLRPLKDLHLYAADTMYHSARHAIAAFSLAAAALLTLLISALNFVNISTVRFLSRLREVGIRKVAGASRRQLVLQFMFETAFFCALAALVAAVLAGLLLPPFNALMERELTASLFRDPAIWISVVLLAGGTGVIAGLYPALHLSAVTVRGALLERAALTGMSGFLRLILTSVQFAVTIGLVAVALIVFVQLEYTRNIDLGFEKERLVVIGGVPTGDEAPKAELLRSELLRQSGVLAVTASWVAPTGIWESNALIMPEHRQLPRPVWINHVGVDYNFFDAYGIRVAAGRDFSREFAADATVFPTKESPNTTGSLILNQSAARFLGFTSPEEAVGQSVSSPVNDPAFKGRVVYTVIGVVPDFHFELGKNPIEPMIFYVTPNFLSQMSVRISGDRIPSTLERIDEAWARIMPEEPITREFLDEAFDALYADESRQSELFAAFTVLAIIIACMGLFGLASFMTARRTREIAIRKVNGATTGGIVRLLLWDFSKPVLLANLIAWPVVWYFMRGWLDGFAYRIDLSLWYFAAAGALALLIAWATVAGHAFRAARTKPALALRYE